MGGKITSDDKETILSAIKEKTEWLEEHTDAEAEDYEDQLSELQAAVGVGHLSCALYLKLTFSPLPPSCTQVVLVEMSRCHSATTSCRWGQTAQDSGDGGQKLTRMRKDANHNYMTFLQKIT